MIKHGHIKREKKNQQVQRVFNNKQLEASVKEYGIMMIYLMFVVTKHRHQINRRIHRNKELPSTVDVNIEKYKQGTNDDALQAVKKK